MSPQAAGNKVISPREIHAQDVRGSMAWRMLQGTHKSRKA